VDQVPTIENANQCVVFKSPSTRIHFVQLDGDGRGGATPMQKLKVRRAIYHAINREQIVKEVKKGFGNVSYGPVPFMMFGFDPAIKDIEPKYDPEKAKALLAEAGYPDGLEIEFSGYLEKTVLEAIQGYLLDVGIKSKLNWYGADLSVLVNLRNAGKVKDMAMYSWGTTVMDAEGFLPYWLAKGSAKSYNSDPLVEGWLVEEAQTFDQEKRKALFKKIQQRMVEQAYWVPIFVEESLYGINKNLNLVSLLETPLFYQSSWK
jgi:peptide/nickel transport system substrate-binding protein